MDFNLVFDFDSTFVKVESLSVMAGIALQGNSEKDKILSELEEVTALSMAGKLDYSASLLKRMGVIKFHRDMLQSSIDIIRKEITDSILKYKDFIKHNSENIHIVSGGFKQVIDQVVQDFAIPSERVFANTITFDDSGLANGVDANNPLAMHSGKVVVMQQLSTNKPCVLVGDGHNDLVAKEQNAVWKFIAFTENVVRDEVVSKADHIAANFDEVLDILGVKSA